METIIHPNSKIAQTWTADEIFRSSADLLATLLPPDIKAECDRLLSENAGSRERWAVYQSSWSHYQHRETMK